MRASNLQELVYKQGQAGVIKATVSITFDNSDSATSPTGYEDKQKITVTRQVRVPWANVTCPGAFLRLLASGQCPRISTGLLLFEVPLQVFPDFLQAFIFVRRDFFQVAPAPMKYTVSLFVS